jgi:uncharacterized membrane protein
MKRLISIDVLRALAILLMIQVHFVIYLSSQESSSAGLYEISGTLGELPAPTFSFLVGLSLWLWLQREASSGRNESSTTKAAVRRGFFLFFSGLAFAVFVWLPKCVFHWDILTLLGASTLVLIALRKWSTQRLVMLAFVVLVISPPLRAMTGYETHWVDWEYVYSFTMQDVVLGFLLHGYFPLLPWLIFPLMGFATGKQFFTEVPSEQLKGWQMPILGFVFGGIATMLSCLSESVPSSMRGYFCQWTFYPASTTFIITMLALTWLGLWVLHRKLDISMTLPKGAVFGFFRRYSKFSLTTYIIHHIVHIWPLYLIAVWQGKNEVDYFYQNAISTPIALLLAALFIVAFYPLLVIWERRKKYSFEGLLRWFSEP